MASYSRARDEFEPVSRDELLDRLRCGAATVLDVRPEDQFANGHLPKAPNIPERLAMEHGRQYPATERSLVRRLFMGEKGFRLWA
jgi:rhodanese-related sulfurtransferase